MYLNSNRIFGIAGLGLLVGGSLSSLQGCDQIADACNLECASEGILEGNASISGVAEVDAFFSAVVDLSAAANGISGTLRAELDAIALSVGLEPGAAGADISAAITAKLNASISGGLSISFQPPRCEASVEVAVAAAAECDVEVDPGSATVSCQGSCEVEGGVMASCEGDATLTCSGPKVSCEGSCEGDCQLDVAASCEGTCNGTCSGNCSVENADGSCAGSCDADCQGKCELSAGGSCSGSCNGSCVVENAASCDANASAKCEASADASIECSGSCEGTVEPPSVSAECEATVEAKANASVECFPPSLEVTWQWHADLEGDLTAQAEFRAWIGSFKGHIAGMLAARAKADILIDALGNLGVAGAAAIEAGASALGSGDFVAAFKVTTCAIPELENVGTVIGGATGELNASVSASIEVFGAAGI